jgi:hypothetical protein
MTDKQMVLDSVRRLPTKSSIREIQDRVNFLVAIKEAERNLKTSGGVPHELVKKELARRIKRWNSKSSGRGKRSTISKA